MMNALLVLLAAPDPGWQWPLRPPPPVVRAFDPPAHPWEAGHRGVDLATRRGRPVYAAGPGRVGFARDLAGRGVVTVVHGRLRTTYLPVRPSVRPGQRVNAGARIGVVEDVLGHCGQSPCLHWGLRDGLTYLDPLLLVGRAPVRLLPWWQPGPTDPPPWSDPDPADSPPWSEPGPAAPPPSWEPDPAAPPPWWEPGPAGPPSWESRLADPPPW
jgi:murein DD-endopeptidase MepM/ murein hydrolase activator NlpD